MEGWPRNNGSWVDSDQGVGATSMTRSQNLPNRSLENNTENKPDWLGLKAVLEWHETSLETSGGSMAKIQIERLDDSYLIGAGANQLELETLEDLLDLYHGLKEYIDGLALDEEWIDLKAAMALCAAAGETIKIEGIRKVLARGEIVGARKESVSGLAKTENGGQWRMPRAAFLAWLAGRKVAKTDPPLGG